MKVEFPTLEPGSRLNLDISNGLNSMEMGSTLVKHIKDHIAVIALDHTERILKFDNVTINVVYTNPQGIPYIWVNAKIVYYQGNYLLQVDPNGGRRHNRRCSFRVGISHYAHMRVDGHGSVDAIVRDISLSGFSVTIARRNGTYKRAAMPLLNLKTLVTS